MREVIGKRTNSPSVESTLGYREVSTALAREAKWRALRQPRLFLGVWLGSGLVDLAG